MGTFYELRPLRDENPTLVAVKIGLSTTDEDKDHDTKVMIDLVNQ